MFSFAGPRHGETGRKRTLLVSGANLLPGLLRPNRKPTEGAAWCPPHPSYLWAAVWSSRAPIEVVLGQKEGAVGHVQDGVVDQNHLAEVKLVGEAFAFGLVQDAFVVVVPGTGG